jgi:VanZ family protein
MQAMKRRMTILPPLLWLALIWIMSSVPGHQLRMTGIFSVDKLAHIGEYLILALLVNRSYLRLGVPSRWIWLVYALLLVSSGVDEWHQYFIPQRSVSVWDFVANAAGLGIGFGLYWIVNDRSKRPTT